MPFVKLAPFVSTGRLSVVLMGNNGEILLSADKAREQKLVEVGRDQGRVEGGQIKTVDGKLRRWDTGSSSWVEAVAEKTDFAELLESLPPPDNTITIDFNDGTYGPSGMIYFVHKPLGIGESMEIVDGRFVASFSKGAFKPSDGHHRLYPGYQFDHTGPMIISWDMVANWGGRNVSEPMSLLTLFDSLGPNWHVPVTVDIKLDGFTKGYQILPSYWISDAQRNLGRGVDGGGYYKPGVQGHVDVYIDKDVIRTFLDGRLHSVLDQGVGKVKGDHLGLYASVEGPESASLYQDNVVKRFWKPKMVSR